MRNRGQRSEKKNEFNEFSYFLSFLSPLCVTFYTLRLFLYCLLQPDLFVCTLELQNLCYKYTIILNILAESTFFNTVQLNLYITAVFCMCTAIHICLCACVRRCSHSPARWFIIVWGSAAAGRWSSC